MQVVMIQYKYSNLMWNSVRKSIPLFLDMNILVFNRVIHSYLSHD